MRIHISADRGHIVNIALEEVLLVYGMPVRYALEKLVP